MLRSIRTAWLFGIALLPSLALAQTQRTPAQAAPRSAASAPAQAAPRRDWSALRERLRQRRGGPAGENAPTARFVRPPSSAPMQSAPSSASAVHGEPQTYKLAPGPFAVETVKDIALHDPNRNKDLPVFLSYPQGDGPLPVIVFSHGAMGSGDMGFPIVTHWTSHGYVVLCPTHADSIQLRRKQGKAGVGDTLANIRGSRQGGWDDNWIERPRDISFVLDALDAIEQKVPALQGKLDRKRIGVGGHSLGAYTAQVVGGATLRVPGKDEPQCFADPRVKAALQLSGQGADQQGLDKRSWDRFDLPMMCVTGSLDRGAQGQDPVWRKDPFNYSPPGGKYFVFIEGAHHGSFTGKIAEGQTARSNLRGLLGLGGRGNGAGDPKAMFDWTKMATLAFWDAYLKDDADAKAYLQSDALVACGGGALHLDRK